MIDKLQERLHDSVLVGLIDKYVGAVLLDEDEGETYYVVLAVQYDERKGSKYYEATCVRVEHGEWVVGSAAFFVRHGQRGLQVLSQG